ncbi:MAG TPA: class I SAM-dependent methyltransferase [Stellaceae bacterium]|nr:class I SAM-dependent methyltransferase [Stellaceae bacterium]
MAREALSDNSADAFESVPCNLCGSWDFKELYRIPDQKYHRDESFQVVMCRSCGLGFVNPRPRPEAMSKYYPAEYFVDNFKTRPELLAERYRREASYLDFVQTPGGGKRRLLDVGCANGAFPRFVRDLGWEVEGVEVAENSDVIDDFPVFRIPFDRIPVAEPRYDAVTAWSVLEHVHDPMAYFRKAAEVLKPGGIFAFVTPNFGSITSRYLLQEDVPRHLYFFDRKSIAAYAGKASLQMIHSRTDGSIYTLEPLHWLRFFLRKLIGRPPLDWKQLPEIRFQYFARLGLAPTFANTVRYICANPLTAFDRLLMPIYSSWQKLTGSYGMAVFVTRKPRSE